MKPPDYAPDYGAAGSPVQRARKSKGALNWLNALAHGSLVGHFVVVFFCGVSTFVFEALVFTFLLFEHRTLAVLSLIAIVATSVYGFTHPRAGAYHRPLAVACLPAALVGATAGGCAYDCYGYFSSYYSLARSYENVAPLSPAGAVADAGIIIFADEAYVDTESSAGFDAEDGRRYCVAPVRGAALSHRAEFWAVGVDCCEALGSFTCGDVADTEAHGGTVFVTRAGLFEDPEGELFMRAERKAQAAHLLQTAEWSMYVRWLRHPEREQSYYALKGIGIVLLWALAYGVGSAPFTWVACKSFAQRFAPEILQRHAPELREGLT